MIARRPRGRAEVGAAEPKSIRWSPAESGWIATRLAREWRAPEEGPGSQRPPREPGRDAAPRRYLTVNVKFVVADCLRFSESLTFTATEYEPGASLLLGVPEITPALLSVSPFGSLPTFFHL